VSNTTPITEVLSNARQWHVHTCDVLDGLRALPDGCVQCCVTSPPYYALRDYGIDGQIGLEETPAAYIAKMVAVFAEVRRVLRDDGTCWLNIGDSYNNAGSSRNGEGLDGELRGGATGADGELGYKKRDTRRTLLSSGIKHKDLMGIPWQLAFALRDDGWYLRSEIIWCLSGGTWVYARTQKGDMPVMVRDLYRLKPETVKLWNGSKWTRLLGMNKSKRQGTELEIVLRSGERISCTPTHKWPTQRGLLEASELRIGDVLETCRLPEPCSPRRPEHIGLDAAWLAGLYIAEGSMSGDTIQIAGHAKEAVRLERIQKIAAAYGGTATCTIAGNVQNIRIYGKVLCAILAELVTGRTSKDKGIAPPVWKYDNDFLAELIEGYLSGDGHWDEGNKRWRLGFTRNYNLERDLRTACARLGYHLTLKPSCVNYKGQKRPAFRGELRRLRSGHNNEQPAGKIVEIRKARCREVYDLGVEDEPHLFSLASGVLTHNSKPNPMPESVTDRPTKAHEQIFLLSKSPRYFFDSEAVKEDSIDPESHNGRRARGRHRAQQEYEAGDEKFRYRVGLDGDSLSGKCYPTRNRRSVWSIALNGFKEAHFATFPPELPATCLKAGTSAKGCCAACGAPWVRVTESERVPTRPGDGSKVHGANGKKSVTHPVHHATEAGNRDPQRHVTQTRTTGWQPTCDCGADIVPCLALDPFNGAGTTGLVAVKGLGLRYIGFEINPKYADMARRRIARGFSEAPKQAAAVGGQRSLFEEPAA
jgi:hypothetical protein